MGAHGGEAMVVLGEVAGVEEEIRIRIDRIIEDIVETTIAMEKTITVVAINTHRIRIRDPTTVRKIVNTNGNLTINLKMRSAGLYRALVTAARGI